MKQALIDILETYGYPVMLQGSLAPNAAYPKSFFTIWNDGADDGSHYDNEAINYIWSFTIYFYSNDPELVNTILLGVKQKLRKNGWIVPGKGYDVPTDQPSHTGRGIDALYIE